MEVGKELQYHIFTIKLILVGTNIQILLQIFFSQLNRKTHSKRSYIHQNYLHDYAE